MGQEYVRSAAVRDGYTSPVLEEETGSTYTVKDVMAAGNAGYVTVAENRHAAGVLEEAI